MGKKIICLWIAICLLSAIFSLTVLCENAVAILLDGTALEFDVSPRLVAQQTMAPLRTVAEAMGSIVEWKADTQTVLIDADEISIKIEVGKTEFLVNGRQEEMNIPPRITDGRTLVPIRTLAESMGAMVTWDEAEQAVLLFSKQYLLEKEEAEMTYTEKLSSRKADISVFYKKIGELELPLQVFLPENFESTKTYPAVIAIHGGGWESLRKTPVEWDGGWMANNVKYYADKGYVGIVFSYRDLRFQKDGDVGNIIEDCYDALAYVAKSFSYVDSDNVLLMGDSAGGHLALCLAMGLADGKELPLNVSKIAAYNPVTDCSDKWSYCAKDPLKYSPVHHAKKVDLDILVMHGTADSVVNIEESRIFTKKMKEQGNQISMTEIPGADHAFILFGYTAKEEDVVKALELTDEYFGL